MKSFIDFANPFAREILWGLLSGNTVSDNNNGFKRKIKVPVCGYSEKLFVEGNGHRILSSTYVYNPIPISLSDIKELGFKPLYFNKN